MKPATLSGVQGAALIHFDRKSNGAGENVVGSARLSRKLEVLQAVIHVHVAVDATLVHLAGFFDHVAGVDVACHGLALGMILGVGVGAKWHTLGCECRNSKCVKSPSRR